MIKSILSSTGLLALAGGIGTAAYFLGGSFNVAADHADPAIVNWAPVEVRETLLARQDAESPPVSLEDRAIVQAGALSYAASGCVYCHGERGVKSAKFPAGPDPQAELRKVVTAGMPGIGVDRPTGSDTNVPTTVAFLKKFSAATDDNFRWWHQTPFGENWVAGCGAARASACGRARE